MHPFQKKGIIHMHTLLISLVTILSFINQNPDTKLLSKNNIIQVINGQYDVIEYDSLGRKINEKKVWFPKEFYFNRFESFTLKQHSLFLNKTSGIVYELKNDSITRIDKSYDDKIHNYSLNFIFKDTLFRFGGYGYFQLNKSLIYFDPTLGQWDLVNYKNHHLIDPFAKVKFHFIKENELHIINYVNHDLKYLNENNTKKDGFVIDLKDRSITKKTKVSSSFHPPNSFYQIDDDYVFLFYPNQRKLMILKIEDLTLFEYTLNTEQASIINEENNNFSRIGDKLFCLNNDINGYVSMNSLSIDSVLKNMTKTGNLYKSQFNYTFYIVFLLIVVFIIYFFILKKSDKKIYTKNGNLIYGKVLIPIDEKMIETVNLLIKSDFVSNVSLNELFYKEGINKVHLNREKNNCIEKINVLFKIHTNKNLIFKRKSTFDKRMTEYYINKKI